MGKLKLSSNPSQLSPNELKFQKLLNSFKVEEHTKVLDYIGFTTHLTSKMDNNIASPNEEELIIKQTLSQKENEANAINGIPNKRKRQTFESQTGARILNTDARLAQLEDYLQKKKVKENKHKNSVLQKEKKSK